MSVRNIAISFLHSFMVSAEGEGSANDLWMDGTKHVSSTKLYIHPKTNILSVTVHRTTVHTYVCEVYIER